jgi:hypothetical protein
VWAVAALVSIFFVQLLAESHLKSPTSDEPPHIASGLSYVSTGIFRGNPEHPPLLKELSGLSLLAGGVRWPRNADTDALLHGARKATGLQPEWEIGNRLIADNGPDRVLFWARLPLMLIAMLLGILVYAWGRHIVGPTAAVAAVLVYTLDPSVIAHAFLVTTDVGLAAFTVLLLLALWRYVHEPTTLRLIVCGVSLGAALCAKFSAVLLLPVVGLLLLAALAWPPASNMKWRGDFTARLPSGAIAFGAMCVIAVVVIQAVYFFSKDPLLYIHGLNLVDANHRPDAEAVIAGELHHRFIGYFAVAYFVKQPLAGIVLTLTGFVLLLRSATVPRLGKVFLLVPAAVLFAGPSLLADPIGIRYIIPVLPIAHILSGLALATLIASRDKWRRGATAALTAWLVVADAGVFPDHLSYFNELACLPSRANRIGIDGGSRCGVYWLDDSNIDWGQSLRQLKTWADKTSEKRTIRYASIYGFPPEAYGLRTVQPPESELLALPVPGLYAISASIVARLNALPEGSGWELVRTPDAIVGHALYIYDVR